LRELGDSVELRIGGDSVFLNSEISWGDCWIWSDGVCRELAEENGMLSELDSDGEGDAEDRGFWTVWAVCVFIIGWLANCRFECVLKY